MVPGTGMYNTPVQQIDTTHYWSGHYMTMHIVTP